MTSQDTQTSGATHSTFVIAISGGSGSGKSTLAGAIVEALAPRPVSLFLEDAYYWPRTHYPDDQPISSINYDDPASKDVAALVADLAQLKHGHTIHQPRYSFETHDRLDGTDPLGPADIIILSLIHI